MNETTHDGAPVLVVGATGDLGGRVVRELLARGNHVRALVREGSDADSLAADGVEIARGDLLDPDSLERALRGARAVVTTATGYRRKGSDPAVDDQGNRNLVDAAARAGVGRFVFTSVATADQAESVAPFWQKKLTEDYLERSGVPFVAIRPGTLVGGEQDFWERDLRKDRLTAFGDPDTPHTLVHIDDVAAYLARAIDEPNAVGRRIEIGMEHPVSNRELAQRFSKLRGREIKLRAIPWPLISAMMRLAGLFSRKVRDFRSLFAYFASGKYVADTRAQAEVFGETPAVDESLRHYLEEKGLAA